MTIEGPARPILTVVSNADRRFFPGLEVAVISAVAAASGNQDYRFLIIDGGLDPAALAKLAQKVETVAKSKGIRASLAPLAIDEARLSALPERRGSRMTYAKLVLPEALGDLDSIVYLDADVLCFAGIEGVRPPADGTGFLLAGARDYFGVIEKDCPWLDQVPAEERKLPYINCGVMWMNLAGLREMEFTGKAIHARASIGQSRQGDQSVFNFLCRGKSHVLPDAINHRTAIGWTKALNEGNLDLNIHYIGSPKPWLGPPKTSNWLAHQLWHQAARACCPGAGTAVSGAEPADRKAILRKSRWYALVNPRRAAHYRSDLLSLKDPSGIREQAAARWKSVLPH